MYAIIRGDLEMSPGKMAAQAGHAFLDAYSVCRVQNPEKADLYHMEGHGTKVILEAKGLIDLIYLHGQASAAGIPCALITDSGHVMPPYFDGKPVVTAVGIGPATRDEVHHLTKKFNLVN